MLIIDGHEDIAYNALAWGRDIRLSAYAIRERETQGSTGHPVNPGGIAMSGLPELRRGGIGIVFGVIFTYPLHNATTKGAGNSQTYSTAEEAYKIGQEQFAYYRELAREPGISLVLNQSDLKKVLNAWEQAAEDDKERPLGIIPLMEGADAIRTPDEVAQWFGAGLRIVGLDQVVRHIDHICQLTGNTRNVAIGSDIDGGFGRDETPTELDTVADLAKLADALRKAGYTEDDVVRVMSGNWRRFLERALPS